jgi:ribosomal protein S18 acetylase RimI-like enzyme
VTVLRPATAADSEFCYLVRRAALGPYVRATWGWEEDVQRGFHLRGFDPERTRIVVVEGRDAGVLVVQRGPDAIYLGRIALLPDAQGRGIGTRLLRGLLAEATTAGLPVELDVLTVNDRAQALYRRLGFTETARHSEGTKVRMRWTPPPVVNRG